ncbi:MAG: polynucleotide adenylyltransferase PcnB [Kofleriaceae bacterium]|nr:polynucleotide adenylyltransferase PcnB [Kofleriaceae bacterium]MBP9169742.1 polynucleotide adenylyltransferase PcnB [Kofleriaceae bacterium]MBP9858158.1 polynucleotide adenylyltransferase PcnB [Kofleriaceae bacterium]
MPALDHAHIDGDAERVVRRLTKGGYTAYLVGGCVRDLLLGGNPKDFDVATSATPNEVRALFRNCRIIGRRFRLAHVFFGKKIIEVATFRANPREDDDGGDDDLLIRRDNVFGTETEDARRRDFTINGLFYDFEREDVIDHVGGLPDLEARLVRTIGDPDVRFREDPVRMLRAIKFAARCGLTIERETYAALLRQREDIRKSAPPRVVEEVYRLLRGAAARRSIELALEAGVADVLSPFLAALYDGAQASEPTDDGGADLADLDDEERAWRRVWYDERPLPARRPPLRLGFLDDAELARRRALAWATLDQLDAAVRRGAEPANALLISALVAPFIADTVVAPHLRPPEIHRAIVEVTQPLFDQLAVPRRDAERVRYALFALRKVAAARAKQQPLEMTGGGRESLEDAVAIDGLLAAARGDGATADATADDEPAEAGADGEGEDGDEPDRKRRRRRRGGRRRREDDDAAPALVS